MMPPVDPNSGRSHSSALSPAEQPTGLSFGIEGSRQFPNWLAEQRISLAFTTYQAGKLFFVGMQPSGRLGVFERTFNRAMGLCSDGQSMWLSTAFQIWRFENVLEAGETEGEFDRLYVPRGCHVTGDIDVHDVAVDADGRLVFVSTLFSCLATTSDRHSFEPLWQPAFISKLAAEDRCHMNGLAMENGQPRYVTVCSRSDVADGWRERRRDGGCVVDVTNGDIVTEGLSMPHSPRLYRDRLWLLEAGTGHFGYVDQSKGSFEHVAFCPGYARGLSFVGDYAVIGLSRPREKTFSGLPLDDELARRGALPRCGQLVVDLRSGDLVHWLRIEGSVEELYDVVVLEGVKRPKAFGFQTDEIRFHVSFPRDGQTQTWSGKPK